ncbi:MAG: hypothetical protein IIZ69_02230, partial [Pseudomonas sp.]|nr:hypothetical protein [Pseudomonas sp.]
QLAVIVPRSDAFLAPDLLLPNTSLQALCKPAWPLGRGFTLRVCSAFVSGIPRQYWGPFINICSYTLLQIIIIKI